MALALVASISRPSQRFLKDSMNSHSKL